MTEDFVHYSHAANRERGSRFVATYIAEIDYQIMRRRAVRWRWLAILWCGAFWVLVIQLWWRS